MVADDAAAMRSQARTVRGSAAPNSLTTMAAPAGRGEQADEVVAGVDDEMVVGVIERAEDRRQALAGDGLGENRLAAGGNEVGPRRAVAEDHLGEGRARRRRGR